MSSPTPDVPLSDANRLGLDYRREAERLRWSGPIYDVHTHLTTLEAAHRFFEVADLFGVEKVWSMTPLEQVDEIRAHYGDRLSFIAVPNYQQRHEPGTFTTDWLWRIERFAEKGARVCKFWAAPRGLDFSEALALDSPVRREGMRLARSLGMIFMTHVADPDTWFATHYRDSSHYGTKPDQYGPLRRMLEEFDDVPWIAAHMGGTPEDLDRLQHLLDDYPHLHVDTSATKWMTRELSRHPEAFAEFARRNRGRLLFGSDIVAHDENRDFDLYASRYWALRTLMETSHEGPSPIVDPDLSLMDPDLPEKSTAHLHGAHLDDTTLDSLYHQTAKRLMPPEPR